VDAILLSFIGGFIIGGYRSGLLHRLGGLAFMALSFVLGAYLRAPIGSVIGSTLKVPQAYGEMVAYIIIFPIILIIAHVVAYPFLKRHPINGMTEDANRVLGAVFGGVEAVLIISAVMVILETYFGPTSKTVVLPAGEGLGFLSSIQNALESSVTASLLRSTTVPLVLGVLGPLLPQDVTTVFPVGFPLGSSGIPGFPNLPFPSGFPTPRPTR
jgi:uncharacterized membrane protein required for colicin V production